MVNFQGVFHTGVLSNSLEESMRALSAGTDLIWTKPQLYADIDVWTPESGPRLDTLRVVYSVQGPQRVEILEGVQGGFWDASGQDSLHHVGIWSDDLASQSKELISAGWKVVLANKTPADDFGDFIYLRHASTDGLLLELVSRRLEPAFQKWWAGESGMSLA